MQNITNLDNPNSVQQMKEWLSNQGVETESLDKKAVKELIKTTDEQLVRDALILRQQLAKSSVKKYQAMQNAVCKDGRAHGMFQFYGANRSGRWAGRLIQLQNLPQNHLPDLDQARQYVIDGDYEMLDLLYDSVPTVLSELIRTAFVPRPRYKFIVSDFSAIEARILAYLAGETWRSKVRGKAAAPVEFGAKLDLSIDENGMARLEKLSFDAYNESDVLIGAIERYREHTGHYPERALADKIYRNRENLAYCKLHGIRLSGPALGRPKKNAVIDKKTEYVDNADRVEVERSFSLAKRCYDLGRIMTKLDVTTKSSIALSILVMNVARIAARSLRQFLMAMFSRYIWQDFLPFYEQKCHGDLLVA